MKLPEAPNEHGSVGKCFTQWFHKALGMTEIQGLPSQGAESKPLQQGLRNAKASLAHPRALWILLGEQEGLPREGGALARP